MVCGSCYERKIGVVGGYWWSVACTTTLVLESGNGLQKGLYHFPLSSMIATSKEQKQDLRWQCFDYLLRSNQLLDCVLLMIDRSPTGKFPGEPLLCRLLSSSLRGRQDTLGQCPVNRCVGLGSQDGAVLKARRRRRITPQLQEVALPLSSI